MIEPIHFFRIVSVWNGKENCIQMSGHSEKEVRKKFKENNPFRFITEFEKIV